MPPIKLKLSLGGVLNKGKAPATPGTEGTGNASASGPSTPQPASYVSGPSTPRPKSEDEAGPSFRVVLPLSGIASAAAASSASTPASSAAVTPSGTPVSTPGYDQPVKRKRGRPRKHHPVPPTAIPPHLATTPRSTAIALSPPASTPNPFEYSVKDEPSDPVPYSLSPDPLASPLSPSLANGTPLDTSAATTPWREESEDTLLYQRPTQKWKRVKKPFKDLANKILAEMRRKDEYGFFLEPGELAPSHA